MPEPEVVENTFFDVLVGRMMDAKLTGGIRDLIISGRSIGKKPFPTIFLCSKNHQRTSKNWDLTTSNSNCCEPFFILCWIALVLSGLILCYIQILYDTLSVLLLQVYSSFHLQPVVSQLFFYCGYPWIQK